MIYHQLLRNDVPSILNGKGCYYDHFDSQQYPYRYNIFCRNLEGEDLTFLKLTSAYFKEVDSDTFSEPLCFEKIMNGENIDRGWKVI